MALNSLSCADVPLSNYSLTHPSDVTATFWRLSFSAVPFRLCVVPVKWLVSSSDSLIAFVTYLLN